MLLAVVIGVVFGLALLIVAGLVATETPPPHPPRCDCLKCQRRLG